MTSMSVGYSANPAISEFPRFTKLGIEHKPIIDAINHHYAPYSDFSFVNLFTWSLDGRTEVALHNKNLIIKLPDYITGEIVYSFIGDNKVDDTIRLLLNLSNKLVLVPEVVIRSIEHPSSFTIIEDHGSSDYIYNIRDIVYMSGDKYKKKRNKLNRFLKGFGDATTTETLTSIDRAVAEEVRVVFQGWASSSNRHSNDFEAERVAIDRLLDNFEQLNLQVMIARINGKMCAFSVNEILPNRYALCHFEKALPVHEGLYAFIIHYAAKVLADQGISIVNWEQDLGLAGLNQAKTSYHPCGFLKKYTITQA